MKNCFTCRKGKEKYISKDNKQMLFYCEEIEKILFVQNYPEYVCEEYEYDNLHVNCTARQSPEARDKGIDQES